MKYHLREKLYCLSEEDSISLRKRGVELVYDYDVSNYYYFLETIKETDPDFFELGKEVWDKIVSLGYSGINDIREIKEWLEFKYKLSYSINSYQRSSLEAHFILDGLELESFILISVNYLDERSKYVLMKEVIRSMTYLFKIADDGTISGPSTHIFMENMKGEN